jgi:N-acetylglucosamine-6-sulfatase
MGVIMNRLYRQSLLTCALGLALAAPTWSKAPNIVFIMADDLDAASAGQMPQVRALLSNQGTSFRHHFVSLSLCCPSRITGLRGQFAQNTTIYTNRGPEGGFEAIYAKGLEASTAATWLSDSGYRTALFGKYLNGYPDGAPSTTYVPAGWTEWYSPNAGDPYGGFNYTLNENGSSVAYAHADADYITDVLSAKASDFIRRSVEEFPEQPFFAYIAPYAPHAPATPAPRHANLFKNIQAPRTASFNEADVSDKPSWVRQQPFLSSSQVNGLDKQYRKRRQSLMAVDELVQNVVDTLQSQGVLDSTYVFFTSDNGFHQGQHRLDSGKKTAFEEDLLIPLMVRGPGVPAGQTVDHITANVDYAPTFADIAGALTPSWVDGRSLLPFLQGQSPEAWRQALLLEHRFDSSQQALPLDGLREPPDPFDQAKTKSGVVAQPGGFLGLRLADGSTYIEYDTAERELYNNISDPAQLRNGYNFASSFTKARLASWLAALKNVSGQTLRDAELAAP